MRRLVCACAVRKPSKTGFLASRPKYYEDILTSLEIISIQDKDQEVYKIFCLNCGASFFREFENASEMIRDYQKT